MAKIMLIRGVPGSGKSTMARKMAGYKHIESDMFLYDESGVYLYTPERVKNAHKMCIESTRQAMESGIDIVVSNTFTRKWEMQPYIDMAKEFGYSISQIIADGNYQNIHNVPDDIVGAMRNRFEF